MESVLEKYSNAVATIDNFIVKAKETGVKNDVAISNYISFVNYNGSETYFTRGAFLHVVINEQMCKDADESLKIKLNDDDYIDSFIENISELMMHYHKTKYLDRAKRALTRLSNKYDVILKGYRNCSKQLIYLGVEKCVEDITLKEYCMEILNKIGMMQTECSKDILECQSFIMMYYCIECIILIFNRYTEDVVDNNFKIFDILKDEVFELL